VVAPNRLKLPPHGGTLTISIVEKVDKKAARSPIARMLAELQRKSKLGDMRPSDDVESLQFDAKWEPMKGVLAANIDAEEAIVTVKELAVVR
jgi:mediator of RNA polymerase II transcription subunit 14